MGSFFTSVQIRCPAPLGLDQVTLALEGLMAARGMTPVADAAAADRTMLIDLQGDWVSVYDEVCDGQDQGELAQLASALSRAFSTHAVTILVHDSDVLLLGLFRDGAQIDRYDSDPNYFEGAGAGTSRPPSGRPAAWAPLLAGPASVEELRRAWADPVQAETVLARTASLVGLDPARASVGYEYATKDDPRYVTLRFRHATRPAYETREEGPPRLENAFYVPQLDVSTGSPVEIHCAIRNGGGVGRGLLVVAYGSAVENGLVSLDAVELTVGPAGAPPTSAPFVDRQSADGRPLRVAAFPSLEVPAGIDHEAALREKPPLRRLMELLVSSQIRARLSGHGRAAGVGALEVGFVVEAPEAQFLHSMALRSLPPARRPLRAAPDVEPHLLRPLQGRKQLVAMASLDLPQAEAAAVAAEIFARWIELFETTERLRLTVFPADGTRPRSGKAKRKGLFASARGRKLREELASARVVAVEGVRLRGEDPSLPVEGFAFGTTMLEPALAHDPSLPTLAVWVSVDGTGEAAAVRTREASALARATMDEVMTTRRGVQALCGRWTWRPSTHLDLSPYESACGVGGSCTLRRSWLTRFLRGVGVGDLWLGAALTARIPDRAALEAAATVTKVGEGLRVEIADPAVDGVEAALAPLLPTASDWREAALRAHRRTADGTD